MAVKRTRGSYLDDFSRNNCAKNTVDKPRWHFIRDRTNENPTLLSFHVPFQHFVGSGSTNLRGYYKKGKEPERLTVDVLLSLSNGVKNGNSETFLQCVVAVKTQWKLGSELCLDVICRERVGDQGAKLLAIFHRNPGAKHSLQKMSRWVLLQWDLIESPL